jgi:hypothetical protein
MHDILEDWDDLVELDEDAMYAEELEANPDDENTTRYGVYFD